MATKKTDPVPNLEPAADPQPVDLAEADRIAAEAFANS